MSLTEQFQRYADKYLAAQHGPAKATDIASWIIRNKYWEPQPADLIRQCARLLARAMRQQYFVDPQGRKVRAKHAVLTTDDDGEQTAFWDDMRTATRNHMHVSLQNRRDQILGDCKQLKTDLDSYNDNHNDGAPIQMIFNLQKIWRNWIQRLPQLNCTALFPMLIRVSGQANIEFFCYPALGIQPWLITERLTMSLHN